MTPEFISLPAFAVIGIEASSDDGAGFVAGAWDIANARCGEIMHLAVTDGGMARIWGLMSDMSRRFMPWEDGFTRGLYLAGMEVAMDAQPPEGWKKWISPAYEYAVFPADSPEAFGCALRYLADNGLALAGAAYDRIIPGTGTMFYLPVRRI